MQKRKLGKLGLETSALGLGTMGMSMAYGDASDETESIATIQRAFDPTRSCSARQSKVSVIKS
jgi:aryl-alcohol dehydrogenase-like predicted oxidoreductase